MGFNTTVMLLNDRLHDIERDTTLGTQIATDVSRLGLADSYRTLQYGKVIETHHNSSMSIVAVGHNMGITLGHAVIEGGDLVNALEEAKVDMLKQLADSLGYRLVKRKE